MSLTIAEVIAKVSPEDLVGVVRDGPVYYLVLNGKKDFLFNTETIELLENVLDDLEAQLMAEEGKPGCLVTVSAAGRKFCTGFDLAFWNAKPMNVISSFAAMLGVYRRFITLPIPSMAVLNGHTYAGGFILAMCHDMRIMTSNKRSKVCLSEMNIGFPLAEAFISVLNLTMSQQAQRPLNMGEAKDSSWCLANDVVTGLYD